MRQLPTAIAVTLVLAIATAGSALAAAPDRATAPFSCPVLTLPEQGVSNSAQFNSIGYGEYTFAPGNAGSADTFNGGRTIRPSRGNAPQ